MRSAFSGHRDRSGQARRQSATRHMGQHHETVRIEGLNEPVKYTVVIEKAPSNYAAYVPALPGCVATGDTWEAVLKEIREAITFHIESLREHGEPVPEPQCTAEVVDVGAATVE